MLGSFFAEGDVDDLAAQLRRLIDEPGLRVGLARRGRERVLAHYTQRAVAKHCHTIYREMLAS